MASGTSTALRRRADDLRAEGGGNRDTDLMVRAADQLDEWERRLGKRDAAAATARHDSAVVNVLARVATDTMPPDMEAEYLALMAGSDVRPPDVIAWASGYVVKTGAAL